MSKWSRHPECAKELDEIVERVGLRKAEALADFGGILNFISQQGNAPEMIEGPAGLRAFPSTTRTVDTLWSVFNTNDDTYRLLHVVLEEGPSTPSTSHVSSPHPRPPMNPAAWAIALKRLQGGG